MGPGPRPRARGDMRDAPSDRAGGRGGSARPAARAWWRRLSPQRAACLALASMAALGALTTLPAPHLGPRRTPTPLADATPFATGGAAAGNALARSAATAVAETSPRELLLASHGRLQWLDIDTGVARLVHEGRGVYYGVFPDGPTGAPPQAGRVWAISRPHNWRVPDGATEAALLLDEASGSIVREVALPTQFTHDAIRAGDKARARARVAPRAHVQQP
jgi:hypothetical protein